VNVSAGDDLLKNQRKKKRTVELLQLDDVIGGSSNASYTKYYTTI